MRLFYQGQEKEVFITEKKSILEVFRENFECSFSSCAKSGTCGGCRVKLRKGQSEPGEREKQLLSPEELVQGYRLGCQTVAQEEMEVEAAFVSGKTIEIMTTNYVYEKQRLPVHNSESCYGIGIDLGTTTIGAALVNVGQQESERIDSLGVMNPQRSFGADVVSRMERASAGDLFRMQKLVQEALVSLIENLLHRNQAAVSQLKRVVLAGNTTMLHILMGQSCETLGKSPFTPVTLLPQQLQLSIEGEKKQLEVLPGISAFVGADIVAGLYALDVAHSERCILLIDLGTNGEMSLLCRGRIFCTAVAAGSAFEGDVTANLPGTDMIALIGDLLEKGILDSTGLLSEEYFEEGYPVSEDIRLTQQHVRGIQMAKAAVYCGVKSLLAKAGISCDEVEQVYLAGGFGQKLSVKMAMRIGLLPEELSGRVTALGNTCLAGCERAVQRAAAKEEIQWILKHAQAMNLAETDTFSKDYMEAINFPEGYYA